MRPRRTLETETSLENTLLFHITPKSYEISIYPAKRKHFRSNIAQKSLNGCCANFAHHLCEKFDRYLS